MKTWLKAQHSENEDHGKGSRDGKRVERERGVNKRSVQWRQKRRTRTKEKIRIRRESCLCLSPQMPADACSVNIGRAPCGSTGKESGCNVGDLGLMPVLGRSPGSEPP